MFASILVFGLLFVLLLVILFCCFWLGELSADYATQRENAADDPSVPRQAWKEHFFAVANILAIIAVSSDITAMVVPSTRPLAGAIISPVCLGLFILTLLTIKLTAPEERKDEHENHQGHR